MQFYKCTAFPFILFLSFDSVLSFIDFKSRSEKQIKPINYEAMCFYSIILTLTAKTMG